MRKRNKQTHLEEQNWLLKQERPASVSAQVIKRADEAFTSTRGVRKSPALRFWLQSREDAKRRRGQQRFPTAFQVTTRSHLDAAEVIKQELVKRDGGLKIPTSTGNI